MKEVRRLYTERQVSDALAMRNGPNTEQLLTLPLQSDVRGWREKYGPYKVLAMNGQTCTIQMPYEQTNFRSTVVKPYYAEEMDKSTPTTSQDNTPSDITITVDHPEEDTIVYHLAKRGCGRPKGSKNKQLGTLQHSIHSFQKGDLELA